MKQIKQKKDLETEVKNREIIYDLIRVIACFFVIGIHCTDFIKLAFESGTYIWWIGNILQAIVRIGLPMFTLLSGALILNGKDEKTSSFYLKRFIKIVIPLYIYSLIYIYVYEYNYNFEIFKPINFINAIKDITKGPVYYHLWYVYMIIGIYLCAPYIKKMCRALSDRDCINLLILIFSISIIRYLLPSIGINIGITSLMFIGWPLIFILGYLITREVINKNYKLIYFLGIISFIIYLIAKRWFPQINNLDDLSITMMLEVMAIYLFFYRNKAKICKNKIINKVILIISKYSWEIYLIHIYVMNLIIDKVIVYGVNIVSASLVLTILVAIISFIIAFIIHNVLIINIQKIINKLILIISKLVTKLGEKVG